MAQSLQGAQDLRIEADQRPAVPVHRIDRQAIARLGINVADVNDLLETAVGGKVATEIFEGERRFPGVVHLPERFRNNIEAISNILITSEKRCPGAWPMSPKSPWSMVRPDLARTRQASHRGRASTSGSRPGRLRGRTAAEGRGPDRCPMATTWVGRPVPEHGTPGPPEDHYPNHHRGNLLPALPALQFAPFRHLDHHRAALCLHRRYRRFVRQWRIPVGACLGGFGIALWGIAVLNGVVLVSYIRGLREEGRSVREAVVEGASCASGR